MNEKLIAGVALLAVAALAGAAWRWTSVVSTRAERAGLALRWLGG